MKSGRAEKKASSKSPAHTHEHVNEYIFSIIIVGACSEGLLPEALRVGPPEDKQRDEEIRLALLQTELCVPGGDDNECDPNRSFRDEIVPKSSSNVCQTSDGRIPSAALVKNGNSTSKNFIGEKHFTSPTSSSKAFGCGTLSGTRIDLSGSSSGNLELEVETTMPHNEESDTVRDSIADGKLPSQVERDDCNNTSGHHNGDRIPLCEGGRDAPSDISNRADSNLLSVKESVKFKTFKGKGTGKRSNRNYRKPQNSEDDG